MNKGTGFLHLGLGILLMSSSGTLGRYIDLEPAIVIWIRCVLGALALYVVLKAGKVPLSINSKKMFVSLLISSFFLGAHWVTYFYSLKFSTVAVGMLALFTYPVITSLLEPLMLKVKFDRSSVFLAIIGLIGLGFLVPEFSFKNEYTIGILIGVFSALCYSIRNIMLKKHVTNQSGIALMYYQLLFNIVLLLPFIFILDFQPLQIIEDYWMPILILSLVTTAAGHSFFVSSFKSFSISTVSIISSVTPLLGSFMGFIVLNEIPATNTYIGGALILLTVVVESIRSSRVSK